MGRHKKLKNTHVAAIGGRDRALIYLRVSTEMQAKEGYGLEAQLDECKKYALHKGYEVIDTVTDEGMSGALADRPALQKAIALCIGGVADVFVCYALDRQARDIGLFNDVRNRFRKAGVRFETVRENMDLTSDSSLFLGDIMAAVAADERRRIASRLLGGRRVRSKTDARGSGPLPYGYKKKHKGLNERGKSIWEIVIDDQAAHVIRLIFNELLPGHTYAWVAEELNRREIPSPMAGKVRKDGQPYSGVWYPGTVERLTRHEELYRTGRAVWDGIEATQPWPIILKRREKKLFADS